MQTLQKAFDPSNEERQAKLARAEELRFRGLRKGEGQRGDWNPAQELWFAVKAVPGSQRSPSSAVDDGRDPSLSLIERNLANAGFESFMPCYRKVIRHHRNHKLIERRFPIFTGYVFVNLPTQQFRKVEAVDGVGKLLKFSRIYGDEPEPFSFAQEVIDRLRYAEWYEDQAFLLAKSHAMRQDEVEREQRAKGKGGPKAGSSRRIRNSQYSELAGGLSRAMTAPSSRVLVMETLDQLLKLG
ncbi:transcription termination/antitermination NusG family protein [Rhizobium grahamii]|uniref:NusG-like N-terminal domain-containing protein n=1 Tax=Rhizobium grahamii TaxID=1120045 RepID=A0A370KRL8_9HYPH|nr:transcription termination/antitermination NusG family protein [Rhizobium grahamii]RDJ12430.1 hypothetical protein B5K06_11900 [Rhizobium grahamii]